jgi:hypothetical protein
MSKSSPSSFVVVGETDYFGSSATLRSVDIGLDGRLRTIRRDYNGSAWRSVIGAATRTVAHGGRFATLRIITGNADPTGNAFGLVAAGSESTATYPGGVTTSIGVLGNGAIIHNTVIVQSGLATSTTGDVFGLRLYRDAGSLKVQFYRNGATLGTAVTLADTAYRLMAGNYYSSTEYYLSVDGDDPDVRAYLPSDTQPWGAAARVADAGGYSPAAAALSTTHSTVTLDGYGRTASQAGVGDGTAYCNGLSKSASDTSFYYVEFEVEDLADSANSIAGLVTRDSTISSYVGSTTQGWGYHPAGGTNVIYNNGAGVSIGAGQTQVAGSVFGVIWQPSSAKIWGVFGSTVFGDPETGTGNSHSNVSGDLLPAISPRANSRIRIRAHAREQQYRPSYAKAWCGADILPEQHYRDAIVGDTEITTGIWFPFPWGGSRRTGSPLGTVVLDNAGGYYDDLRWYNLRDEELVVYELVDDRPEHLARVMCDSVFMDGESTVSIASRGLDCLMDVHIDEPAALFGQCNGLVPGTPISATQLIWDLTHSPYFVLSSLLDEGAPLTLGTGWFHSLPATAQGWRLGANPAGTLAAPAATMYRRSTQVSLTNASFTAWTADNPDGWTVTESGPSALITQSSSAARFVRTGGSATLNMTQAISPPSMTGAKLFAILNITARVSGDLKVGLNGGSPTNVGINSTGLYIVPLSGTGSTLLEIKCDDAVTDITLADVEVWHCTGTSTRAQIFEYLLEDYGGLTESQYDLGTPPSSYTVGCNLCGFWTRDRPTVRQIVDDLCQSWLCDYYTSADGVLTFVSLEDTSGKTPTGTLLEIDARGPLSISDDLAPALTDSMFYDLNYAPYSDSDLAGSVTAANRALYTAEGAIHKINASHHAFYAHATGAPTKPTRLNTVSVANVMTVLNAAYVERKWFFEREYDAEKVRTFSPGDYITVKANRFGLSAGEVLMLVSKTRRLKSPLVRCKFWGST